MKTPQSNLTLTLHLFLLLASLSQKVFSLPLTRIDRADTEILSEERVTTDEKRVQLVEKNFDKASSVVSTEKKEIEQVTNLVQNRFEVNVKLQDIQADPNSPLYSVKSFDELGLYSPISLQENRIDM